MQHGDDCGGTFFQGITASTEALKFDDLCERIVYFFWILFYGVDLSLNFVPRLLSASEVRVFELDRSTSGDIERDILRSVYDLNDRLSECVPNGEFLENVGVPVG